MDSTNAVMLLTGLLFCSISLVSVESSLHPADQLALPSNRGRSHRQIPVPYRHSRHPQPHPIPNPGGPRTNRNRQNQRFENLPTNGFQQNRNQQSSTRTTFFPNRPLSYRPVRMTPSPAGRFPLPQSENQLFLDQSTAIASLQQHQNNHGTNVATAQDLPNQHFTYFPHSSSSLANHQHQQNLINQAIRTALPIQPGQYDRPLAASVKLPELSTLQQVFPNNQIHDNAGTSVGHLQHNPNGQDQLTSVLTYLFESASQDISKDTQHAHRHPVVTVSNQLSQGYQTGDPKNKVQQQQQVRDQLSQANPTLSSSNKLQQQFHGSSNGQQLPAASVTSGSNPYWIPQEDSHRPVDSSTHQGIQIHPETNNHGSDVISNFTATPLNDPGLHEAFAAGSPYKPEFHSSNNDHIRDLHIIQHDPRNNATFSIGNAYLDQGFAAGSLYKLGSQSSTNYQVGNGQLTNQNHLNNGDFAFKDPQLHQAFAAGSPYRPSFQINNQVENQVSNRDHLNNPAVQLNGANVHREFAAGSPHNHNSHHGSTNDQIRNIPTVQNNLQNSAVTPFNDPNVHEASSGESPHKHESNHGSTNDQIGNIPAIQHNTQNGAFTSLNDPNLHQGFVAGSPYKLDSYSDTNSHKGNLHVTKHSHSNNPTAALSDPPLHQSFAAGSPYRLDSHSNTNYQAVGNPQSNKHSHPGAFNKPFNSESDIQTAQDPKGSHYVQPPFQTDSYFVGNHFTFLPNNPSSHHTVLQGSSVQVSDQGSNTNQVRNPAAVIEDHSGSVAQFNQVGHNHLPGDPSDFHVGVTSLEKPVNYQLYPNNQPSNSPSSSIINNPTLLHDAFSMGIPYKFDHQSPSTKGDIKNSPEFTELEIYFTTSPPSDNTNADHVITSTVKAAGMFPGSQDINKPSTTTQTSIVLLKPVPPPAVDEPHGIEPTPQAHGVDLSFIPGQPGINYPTYSKIPVTRFSCSLQQHSGYYADPTTQCQVFHICLKSKKWSFLCPNGTIFSQEDLVCVWWNEFDCSRAEQLYDMNDNDFDSKSTAANPRHKNLSSLMSTVLNMMEHSIPMSSGYLIPFPATNSDSENHVHQPVDNNIQTKRSTASLDSANKALLRLH